MTAFVILDSSGNTVLSKYYDPLHASQSANPPIPSNPFKTPKEQRAFEKGLYEKTRKSNSDIILYSNHLVVYKSSIDLVFYVVGREEENELILQLALTSVFDAASMLLKHQVEKRSVLENLDLVVLALDEAIDDGYVLLLALNDQWSIHAVPTSLAKHRVSSVTLADFTVSQHYSGNRLYSNRIKVFATAPRSCVESLRAQDR